MVTKKPSKKECDAYILRKYIGSDSELKPKNISSELTEGSSFKHIETIGGRRGITITNK